MELLTLELDNITHLSDIDLEILNILWLIGPSTVREVHEVLEKNNNIRHTVTLRLMQVLHHKELISRDDSTKKHIYSTSISKEMIQEQLVQRMIKNVFGGSSTLLIKHLLDHNASNEVELEDVKKYFG